MSSGHTACVWISGFNQQNTKGTETPIQLRVPIHPSIRLQCNYANAIHPSLVYCNAAVLCWDLGFRSGWRPAGKKVRSERDRQTESGSCTNSASPSSHSHPHIISLRLTPPYCVRCDAHAGTQCLAFAPPVPGMPSDQLVVFVLLCCAADREGKGVRDRRRVSRACDVCISRLASLNCI
jgi:hypothetical protein